MALKLFHAADTVIHLLSVTEIVNGAHAIVATFAVRSVNQSHEGIALMHAMKHF